LFTEYTHTQDECASVKEIILMQQRGSEFEAVKKNVPSASDSWSDMVRKEGRSFHCLMLKHKTRYADIQQV
jgi:hypothetical protein